MVYQNLESEKDGKFKANLDYTVFRKLLPGLWQLLDIGQRPGCLCPVSTLFVHLTFHCALFDSFFIFLKC